MTHNRMSTAVRQNVTEAAVMESIAENKVVEDYYLRHPGMVHEQVTLQDIIDHARNTNQLQDPNMQILQDYFKDSRNASQYVIHDYDRTKRSDGSNEDWEANLMVTTPGNGKEPGLYVAYRGTQYGEGHDNAEGMYMTSTPQQREAREYFDRLVRNNEELFAGSNVQLVGHSKGGNKAMFVNMTSQYGQYIDGCVALDGQGYSPEAIEYFMQDPTYEQRRAKITLVAGKYDYVHALGTPIVSEENLYYVETQPTHGADSFHSMHWEHYMFVQDENGNFTSTLGDDTAPAEFVGDLKEFSEMFMTLPAEQRKESAHTIMDLLWPGAAPDGANLDPNAIVTVCTLMEDPVKAYKAISGAVLAAWPQIQNLEKILKAGKKIAEMFGVELPALTASGLIPLGVALFTGVAVYLLVSEYMDYKAEQKAEMLRNVAVGEALEHPEFCIEPDILTEAAAADANGRVGSLIADVQSALKNLSNDPMPNRDFRLPDILGTGGMLFNMNELHRLNAINDNISIKKKEIRAMEDNYKECIKQLEGIKETLNCVIAYMSDTGNEFANIENTIASRISEWGSIAKGKK